MRIATQTDQNEKTAARSRSLQTVRDKLETERREICDELESSFQPREELAEGWQERDSPAERETREIEYLHRESLLLRLRQISNALERLESGSHGLCSECERRIEKKRLKNDPAVALCLRCQQVAESVLAI